MDARNGCWSGAFRRCSCIQNEVSDESPSASCGKFPTTERGKYPTTCGRALSEPLSGQSSAGTRRGGSLFSFKVWRCSDRLAVRKCRAGVSWAQGPVPLTPRLAKAAASGLQSHVDMPSKEQTPFEVACHDCGAMLKVDPATRAVIAHTPAPRKRTFEDFETAARAMREQDERKESLFRQAVDAEKNKNDLLEKKFAEALRKAKETPDTGKPLRDFDLDLNHTRGILVKRSRNGSDKSFTR